MSEKRHAHPADRSHNHDHKQEKHSHTHGAIDPSIATTERGI